MRAKEANPQVAIFGRLEPALEAEIAQGRAPDDDRRGQDQDGHLEEIEARGHHHPIEEASRSAGWTIATTSGLLVVEQARDERDLGIPIQQLELPLQFAGFPAIIGVEESDEFAPGLIDAEIAGAGRAAVRL